MQGSKQLPVKGNKKKSRVSNQVKLDANNPIPFEYGGTTFSFINNVFYLPFLPPKDEFAKMLLEARLLSVTHNACVSTKTAYCKGEGFMDEDGVEFTDIEKEWLKTMNLNNQGHVKINKRIFEDFFTYGNVPVEIVRFTVAGKKKLFVYPHSFLEWRLVKPDKDGIVREAVQSKLFLRSGYVTLDEVKNGKRLPLYNPMRTEKENWVRDEKGVERTLLWYKNEVTGFPYYGVPSAVSAMIYQLLEYKGARYNLDNFDNNMVVASILALKGNLSDGEANKIGRQIINQHTGDGKRGRTVVVASEEGIDDSNFHKLDTKTDGSFVEADAKWSEKIVLANEWDAVLAGLLSPSTLGKGNGFLNKLLEVKLNTVIKPAQRDIITEVWSHIFAIADAWIGTEFGKKKIAIKNSIDISGLTDVDITPAVQVNEVRKAKGLAEDPSKNGVYMKATAPKDGAADPNADPNNSGGGG
jgi:hypothetical protein